MGKETIYVVRHYEDVFMRGRQKTYEAVLISHVCRLSPYHLITIREDGLIVYVRRVESI